MASRISSVPCESTSADNLSEASALQQGVKSVTSYGVTSENNEGTTMQSEANAKQQGGPKNIPGKYNSLFSKYRHETITYCLVFWAFGMCVALLGPTLLDLGCKTSNLFSTMSWAFFAQSLFILIGSATGGLLVRRYGQHPILLTACAMLSLTLAVIAFCERMLFLVLVLAVMGYFMGIIDTVANLAMLELYGKNVAPFLQALHFFYGLGAFLSPLISIPFLLDDGCNPPIISNRFQRLHNSTWTDLGNFTVMTTSAPITRIQYAFWIMALLQLPVILMVSSLMLRKKREKEGNEDKPPEGSDSTAKNAKLNPFSTEIFGSHNGDVEHAAVSKVQVLLVTSLTALLLFLYDGLQASFGGYVYSYAIKSSADLSVPKAAYLNACFWGTFAFGRLISIWLATRMTPGFMLSCNIIGCLVSMILMVMAAHSHSVLYIGTCLFGVSLSSVYPTVITLAETYVPLTSPLTTIMVVSAAAGEMSMPVIVGHEFEALGPTSFLATGLIVTLVSAVIYFFLYLTGSTILRQTSSPGMFSALADCFRPRDLEDTGLMQHQVKYYSRMKSEHSESSMDQNESNDRRFRFQSQSDS